MQTLNLNLSLQINIGTDGKADVKVLNNDTTPVPQPAPEPSYHAPVQPVVPVMNVIPMERTEQDIARIADTASQAMAHVESSAAVLDAEPVAPPAEPQPAQVRLAPPPPPPVEPQPVQQPAQQIPPPPPVVEQKKYRTDFDIAALTKQYVSNPVMNVPTDEELERLYTDHGITAEDWFNHPDYKTWIAPKQSAIDIPEQGIDLDSEGDGSKPYVPNDDLPIRPAPKPRGSIRAEAKRIYGNNYAAIESTVEQLEYENDLLYLPRNPSEKAAMTPEQLAMAAEVLAEIEAKEQQKRAQAQPVPPPPPPVAPQPAQQQQQQQQQQQPAQQTPPPPPPVVSRQPAQQARQPRPGEIPTTTFEELMARVEAGKPLLPTADEKPAVEMPVPMTPVVTSQQMNNNAQVTQVGQPAQGGPFSDADKAKIETAAQALFGN